MKGTFVRAALVVAIGLGITGCGGGGLEEGVPPNATYTPPLEQPTMKPISNAEIQAKAKAAETPPSK